MTEQHKSKRGFLSPGYLTFTGKRLNQAQCDAINWQHTLVLAFEDAGRIAPEYQLNARHKAFVLASEAGL